MKFLHWLIMSVSPWDFFLSMSDVWATFLFHHTIGFSKHRQKTCHYIDTYNRNLPVSRATRKQKPVLLVQFGPRSEVAVGPSRAISNGNCHFLFEWATTSLCPQTLANVQPCVQCNYLEWRSYFLTRAY